MKFLLIILAPFLFGELYSQSDTINQFGEKKLKQGYWIEYGKGKKYLGYSKKDTIGEGFYIDNFKEGVWKKYHPSGQLKEIGEYKKNRKDGEWKEYYENGKLKSKTYRINSRLNGKYTVYYKSERIEQEGEYKMGKIVGEVKFYFDNDSGDYVIGVNDSTLKTINQNE